MVRRGAGPGDANQLWIQAQRLRRNIIEHAWIAAPDKGGYFAAGVERNHDDVRPLGVRTANMAMLLNTRLFDGIAYQRYISAIVEQLKHPEGLMSNSGIRTLAADEVRFRPDGTYTGAVWPWQNLWIASGLRKHNQFDLARDIEQKMQRIVEDTKCVPQFVHGGTDVRPRMVEMTIDVTADDGHGGRFDHLAVQPAAKFSGMTTFGLWGLELGESFESPLDMLAF
jgi:hypothetical protein